MKIKKLLAQELNLTDEQWEEPIFIKDGYRRRASFTFLFKKGQLLLGFNENKSDNIVNCTYCPMLTEKINKNINGLHNFLENFSTQITRAVSEFQKLPGFKNIILILFIFPRGNTEVRDLPEADVHVSFWHL